ncbi:MAG: FAD-dependent oxidoreductase [Candidatus Lindowbacteria bacterium]|nr:FAD-dependent oxidoreductase [Candidatus Lindowbacteria bacterium]
MKKIRYEHESDMPLGPVSEAGQLYNLTGSWRYLRPRYEKKLAPCIAACPAGERIEAWIRLIEEEKYFEAWQLIIAVNPFPRICGRVCFHPCESECNRGEFDRPIAIHSLERFVSDHGRSLGGPEVPKIVKSGKSVGVIGSGPAGLSCAHHLAKRGHSVTLYEAETELGGLLRYGIPAYRLPRNVLDEEIDDILKLGVEVRTGTRIETLEPLRKLHNALFLATGFGKGNQLGIAGEQGSGVFDALAFLKLAHSGRAPEIKGKVLVIGGGNAAIDAARTVLRLGAEPTILYRRSRAEMPASLPEIEEAEKEGISIRYLVQPTEIVRENGRVALVQCVRNELGEVDESGRRQPVPALGSNFFLEAEAVIIAAGERPDKAFLKTLIGPNKITGGTDKDTIEDLLGRLPEGVFAGGDLTSPLRTVAYAIGSGRSAAVKIDKYLGGAGEDPADYVEGRIVRFKDLNLDYFPHKPRLRLPMLPLRERAGNYREVSLGINTSAAAEEVERCFHCGVCISCDNCYLYCPDIAVKKTPDGAYSIDYDYCKGCGICVHECPRNAMSIDEEIRS